MTSFKKVLVIDSNPNNILKVQSYLNMVNEEYRDLSDRYADVLISFTEALNNAIIHGNKADESKKVKINMEQEARGLALTISDEGTGFDPEEVPDPTRPENLECCGGRGVHIMESLSDQLSFDNNGSTVKMYFKLS